MARGKRSSEHLPSWALPRCQQTTRTRPRHAARASIRLAQLAWTARPVTGPYRMAFLAAITVAVVGACGLAATVPSSTPATVQSPTPATVPSPTPVIAPKSATTIDQPPTSAGQGPVQMTVAGTDVGGSPLRLTVDLPESWTLHNGPFAANRGTAHPPAGISFFVSLVDNTFEDPCSHLERSPKIGSAVEDLATALGEIPNTTATKPVATTIAQREATYVELSIPATLPCEPSSFYLWQDSPNGYWWALGGNETIRVWIVDVGDQRVAIAARSYPGTSEEATAELQGILESMVFDAAT